MRPDQQQRHFTFLKLRFNLELSQLDMFSEVVTQRSEHDIGVWLSGLDVAAQDALRLAGGLIDPPPIACYLHRGLGGAIRRGPVPDCRVAAAIPWPSSASLANG